MYNKAILISFYILLDFWLILLLLNLLVKWDILIFLDELYYINLNEGDFILLSTFKLECDVNELI